MADDVTDAGSTRLGGRERGHAGVPGAGRVGGDAGLLHLGADAAEEPAGVVECALELLSLIHI